MPALQELSAEDPDVEMVWRAFELRPEPAPILDPKGEYLQRAWRDGVYPLAARLGMTMRLPPLQPRSRLAHEAAHWARSRGRFEAFHEAVFRAFFERGEDIGAIEALATLATGVGLPGEELGTALAEGWFLAEVLEDERDAALLDVSGVPAFLADRRAGAAGVQPVEALRALVRRARGRGPGL